MTMSLTHLRTDLYKIIDQILETGIPVEIERRGKKLRIIAMENKSKLANLTPHPDTIIGDPDSIVHIDWSEGWDKGQEL